MPLYESPHANLEVLCRNQMDQRHPVTGDIIGRTPAIYARFGKMGATYEYVNPLTQETEMGADIHGHFFDTDVEAVEQDWDPDVKAMVERTLDRFCETQGDRIKRIERVIPKAEAPWPTYDTTDVEQIVTFASTLGLVDQALAYERENLQRPFVLDGLTAEQPETDEQVEPVAAPEKLPRAKDGPQEVGNPATITV